MKKIITLLLFTVFIYTTASSQILIALLFGDKLNNEKLEFGLNMTTLSNVDADSYSGG